MRLFDTHCHLDLYPDFQSVISEINSLEISTIAVTTTPSVFARSSAIAASSPWINTALGMHPELVADRHTELPLFLSLVGATRFVGEVGLDFVDDRVEARALQERVFATILEACSSDASKILTIHSRRSAERVVEMIGPSYAPTTILHWFTGTTSTLKKAIANGCYFSINPSMLGSSKGIEMIRQIPLERILLESDGPFATLAGVACRPKDTAHALKGMAHLFKINEFELGESLFSNFQRILKA